MVRKGYTKQSVISKKLTMISKLNIHMKQHKIKTATLGNYTWPYQR